MSRLKKGLALVLTLCMMLSLMPVITPSAEAAGSDDDFYKIVHLDCGRKYFTTDWIKSLIDEMAADGYTHLELAFGNDGLRFLLDDMSVTANDTTYTSADVTAGIQAGNTAYYDFGTNELTEAEMDEIIEYAAALGIEIIPLLNTPGHMDAIITCMENLGIDGDYNGSVRTVDVTNSTAVAFTQALVNKYIQYFVGKGCTVFNIGADEYANDVYTTGGMGFAQLVQAGQYDKFVEYVNGLADLVSNVGMTPMAFNDGIYYGSTTSYGTFNKDIMIAYWSSGWNGYNVASASYLANQGHKMINTNGDFYYVLGKNDQFDSDSSYAANWDNKSFQGTTFTEDQAGAMFCIWCDYPNAETEDQIYTKVVTNGVLSAMGAAMSVEEEQPVEVTEEKTITVTAGGTATDTISDYNFAGTYTTEDPSIATVKVTGTDGSEATATYSKVTSNPNWNTLISSNTTSATSYYYLASDGNYYRLYVTRSDGTRSNRYNYSLGYYANGSSTLTSVASVTNNRGNNAVSNVTLYTKSGTEATPASTTVTFTGVAVGTTYVTVGNTKYTINVVAEDLSKVTPLTIEYWITNGRPVDTDNSKSYSVSAETAYSQEGVDISTLLPVNTTRETRTLQYWRGRLLDTTKANSSTSGTEEQTETAGDDETYNGVEFTKVRYWDGNWEVYTENNEWVTVTSDHQLVAYYLEILPVSDELRVTAADWGKKGDGSTSGDYLVPNSSCTVSVQVVYEDGTTNPATTTAADLKSTTIAYGYWESGRGIGTLNLSGLEGYQIWKIEAETGAETYTSSSSTWGSFTVDSFTWDNNAMTVYEGDPVDSYILHNDSNNPSKNGYYANLMWDENYEAILIKVYVKAPVTEDSLKVHYMDRTANDAEFYSYNISVASGTAFDVKFALDANYTDIDNALTGNTVENILGVIQTVTANLGKMSEIGAQYRYSDYTCVQVTRSQDGKDVYLYYTFNNAHSFVVDFGLPLTITTSDLDISGDWTDASVSGAKYGTATATVGNGVTYTPTQTLKGVETLQLTLTDSTGSVTHTIYIYPATTVYYEEGFAALTGFNGGSTGTGTQATQVAGRSGDEYGKDTKYVRESAGASNGTQATSSAKGDKAEFTFTGTGVDIYANSTTATGWVMIKIADSSNATVKLLQVNTALLNGSSDATNNQEVTGYNVPVASITGLANGTYTVTITHVDDKTVNLDGFRVYGTLATEPDFYKTDLEDNPTFIELRDQVLAGLSVTATGSNQTNAALPEEATTVALVASSDKYTQDNVNDLLTNGPKNEIYLQPNQALVVKITTDREVQIGLKALNAATTYTINNGDSKNISTSTDMFYTVLNKGTSGAQTITITNTGTGILSVTKLKVCDDPNAALGTLTEEDLTDALVSLGLQDPPVEDNGSSGTDTPTTPPTTDPGTGTPTTPADPATGLPFTDVGPGDWFLENVKYVYEKGLMNGTGDTTFSPKKTTNRAMIVTILHRLEGTPAPDAQAPFTDVPAGQYYAEAVAWAAANSIVNGTSETTYAPLNNITREQMAAILYRYAQYKGYDVSGSADLSAFTDATSISDYAVSALQWAVDAGLINGKGNGILDPKGSATRAEVSAILSRFCENIAG